MNLWLAIAAAALVVICIVTWPRSTRFIAEQTAGHFGMSYSLAVARGFMGFVVGLLLLAMLGSLLPW